MGWIFSQCANNLTSTLSNYRAGSVSREAFVLSLRPSPRVCRCELGTAWSWRWSWYFTSEYRMESWSGPDLGLWSRNTLDGILLHIIYSNMKSLHSL